MQHKQALQDEEYGFPYHYITTFENGKFRQCFNDTWGINYVSTIEFLLERLRRIDFESIVDIGCGDGRFTRELETHFQRRCVLGIDYSPRAIRLAQAMNCDLGTLTFRSCDVTQLAQSESHDAAVLMEVFEHIPPEMADSFVSAVRRLLRPRGNLLVTVPHVNKPVEYKHYRHFDLTSLSESLAPYFEILDAVPFERIAPARHVVDRCLSNRAFILNNQRLLNWIYAYYKKHLFYCKSEAECQRLFVHAIAK